MKKYLKFLSLFWIITLVVSCSDQIISTCDTGEDIAQKVTFSYLQNEVFTPLCVGCHGGSAPQGKLDLSAGNAYYNLVNAASTSSQLKRVKPGDSQSSYLMKRMRGEGNETVMPPGGKLATVLLDSIAAWIDRGAPQD
ncbi:MAG TPA: hypothetical protein EYP36_02345 [Calditrichaeota bacterium]|nr:hypothetical protein [Calditrichota bacterium]